jgi:hypothetical protein
MMLYNPWLALAFYGSCALFALLATWRKEGIGQLGVMLMLCWVASNVLWFFFPLEWRPAVFPILDVLFALTAAKARMETDSRVPLALIALSIMAISASTAISILGVGSWQRVAAYELSLNIIFVLQCAIVGGWGIADAVARAGGVWHGSYRVRRASEPFRSEEAP